jgi:signal transduction histidine kinase
VASPLPDPTPAALFAPADWLALLDVSLTGINLLRPLYGPAGELADFALEYLNPAAQRMAGLAAQPGGTLLTHFPDTLRTGVFAFYQRVFETGEAGHYRFPYRADGLDNYFHLAARRSGERLVVSLTDTSDHDRSPMEVALRESQAREQAARAEAERQRILALAAQREAEAQRQRLYAFMSAAPGVVLRLGGPQHVIEFANEGFRQQFGVADPVGKPFLEALPAAAAQYAQEYQATALYDHVYHTGEPYYAAEAPYYVDNAQTGQRELRYFTFAVQAARAGSGSITGVQAYASDVTAQVLARQQVEHLNQELETRVAERTRQLEARQAEALADAEHRAGEREELYQVLAQTPAAVAITRGAEHRYIYANPATQALFATRQLVGRTVAEALPEAAGLGLLAMLDQVYATGETFFGAEWPLTFAGPGGAPGEARYFNFTYQAYREGGQVVGISTFAYDVTEQVLARQLAQASQQQVYDLNEELAVLNEELQATNEELGESNTRLTRTNVDLNTFVYTASHDLKVPITNIEGILAALRETLPPAVQQEEVVAHILGLLDNTVERFLLTINDLTDLARLQQSYNEPAERLALAPVVAGVVADLGPAIKAAGATLHQYVAPGLHLSFAPASLRSIVYNLLSNAVKYRDPARPAQVWLRAERQPGEVVLAVGDNGLGLTPAQQQRLFGVFQRMHTHVEGTGVGLYMIKRLIDNAGARISVKSEPGVGSTFIVTFPA